MVNIEYWLLFQTQKGATLIGKKKETNKLRQGLPKSILKQISNRFTLKLWLIFTSDR